MSVQIDTDVCRKKLENMRGYYFGVLKLLQEELSYAKPDAAKMKEEIDEAIRNSNDLVNKLLESTS